MKKLLACLAALVLLTSFALADVEVETVPTDYSASLCTATNNYIARLEDGYHLFDADGNVLSAAYSSIAARRYGLYVEVQDSSNTKDLNYRGLLDAQGKQILPMQYADFDIFEPDWVLAYVLGPSDSDVGEYKDSKGNKYIVTRTDVLYKGELIGTLTRDDYIKSYSVGVAGPYLYVKRDSKHMYWLDGDFNRLDVESKDYVTTKEFTEIYKKGIFHNPTQQYAFVPGCTLTPDQVDQPVWLDTTNGQILDLQGNVLASGLVYDYVYFRGNCFTVRRGDLWGILDLQGNEIVAPLYDEIAYHEDGMFLQGYNAVLDEKGRLSYIDVNGNVTASVDYELTSSDYKGFSYNAAIVAVKNMGKYMLISATHGELPGKYDDVSTTTGYHPFIAVQKDGLWGVINMAGETVVPFELRWTPTISKDGTIILGSTEAREYFFYKVTVDTPAAIAATESPAATEAPATPSTPAAPAGDGWICSCGAGNNGKFCAECGSPKPVVTEPADDGSWSCPGCGRANTGKFCPECGTPKPEAVVEPQCSGCGWKPEGDAPKFCPECGTRF